MLTHNLGYPRIGSKRELKRACEQFWAGKISKDELLWAGRQIRRQNWQTQKEAGIELIPSNDFSYYDQVLDTSLMLGAVPERYHALIDGKTNRELDIYFAMARGIQKDGVDIKAMEMTKWFDTNYHYIVPEFTKDQSFKRYSDKIIHDFEDAKQMGIITKPVLLGPVSYLLLGKEKESGFNRIDLLDELLPVYTDVLRELLGRGASWVQFDEPCLTLDLSAEQKVAFQKAYETFRQELPQLKSILATYFDKVSSLLAFRLPVHALHLDLVRGQDQLEKVLTDEPFKASGCILSLGIVDGRNVWKNDYEHSLSLIQKAVGHLGKNRVWVAPSCSLLHCPCDLELEINETVLTPEIKNWMAFARQKLTEVVCLARLASETHTPELSQTLAENLKAMASRRTSPLIHKEQVKNRVLSIQINDFERRNAFPIRQKIQEQILKLPLLPTTTIGSFPQTDEVRQWRAKYRKGEVTQAEYEAFVEEQIEKSIRWQEEIGLDVLVHGEFERNDMVEYFGEQLAGYVFTQNGWVQSYGSRCVKPPIIYGDIERPEAMTVRWSTFAQSKTKALMKGMLTGPVTILQWSFVRDDQPRSETAFQIALAIRDEVLDLEKAGIRIIQIDEPAIREGLPLRKADWAAYLTWAVNAFKLSAAGVADQTQIHTHMCYSEFNDIIDSIARMDADVITIETSRSQMELLEAFSTFHYPNEIGPGVYDIHSPRVPNVEEMEQL
ncbi:MAG: 5-methyltetrahydropteroyltriglutamate--homocysteine S-methyltransferase, partial [Siphonobacter sp.]